MSEARGRSLRRDTGERIDHDIELAKTYADDGALKTGAALLRAVAREWSRRARARDRALRELGERAK